MAQTAGVAGTQGQILELSKQVPPPGASFRSTRGGADKASVVLVDPRPLTRASVADLLARVARNFVVSPVSSVANLPDGRLFDNVQLVLFNVGAAQLGDAWVMAEIDAIARYVPSAPLVLLSDSDNVSQVAKALRLGVRGYIPTTFSPVVAVEAMRLVHAGGTFVPANAVPQSHDGDSGVSDPGSAADVAVKPTIPVEDDPSARSGDSDGAVSGLVQSLTPRQREVLRLLCEGKPNKIIAHALGMQEGTVKVHVRQIMKKLKATNRTEVAFLANRLCGETQK